MALSDRCQHIVDAAESLSPTEIDELFKILHASGCEYSKNNNGVFVNLRWVDESIIAKIEQFLAFCNRNRIELEKYERLRRLLTENFASSAAGGTGRPAKGAADAGCDEGAGLGEANLGVAAAADVEFEADACGEPVIVRKPVTQNLGAVTTMKFYLLKKKFAKPSSAAARFEQGELTKEPPVLAQKRS